MQEMQPIKYTSIYKTDYRMIQSVTYPFDCGYAHIRSYHLFLASVGLGPLASPRIGRYLDGEEEREGLYR